MNNYAKFLDRKFSITQNAILRAGENGTLRNTNRRYPGVLRKLEHERTPGEVAVMWYEAQGM